MQHPINTMVFPIVREDLIIPALESFWKHSDREVHRVIVIDQSVNGLPDLVNEDLAHVHFRVYRNLGFAKACNTGIRLADTDHVTLCNDDVSFFDERWWPALLEMLNKIGDAMGMNPSCPKIPGWGIGKKEDTYIAGIDSREACLGFEVWETLIRETPHKGLVNGVAMWCTTFKREELLEKIGLFDERFYPGAGEDYDMLGRCAKAGYHVYGTHMSWVWHDWGQTKDVHTHQGRPKMVERPGWNKLGELWPDGFDAWGRKGDRIPDIHVDLL